MTDIASGIYCLGCSIQLKRVILKETNMQRNALLIALTLATLVCSPLATHAAQCSPGEKRLHESDTECIPISLHSYLFCLENTVGGGAVEVQSIEKRDKSKGFDIRFKAGASGVVISGEGAAGFSKSEADKLENVVKATYNPTLVTNCARYLPTDSGRIAENKPDRPRQETPSVRNLPLPDLRGLSFTRNAPEVVFANQGNIRHCSTHLSLQEVLHFDTGPGLAGLSGTLSFIIAQRRTWSPIEGETIDIMASFDKESARRCVVAIPTFVAAESAIEVYSTTKELRYTERVVRVDRSSETLVQRKEGSGPYDGLAEIFNSTRSISFDRNRVFVRN